MGRPQGSKNKKTIEIENHPHFKDDKRPAPVVVKSGYDDLQTQQKIVEVVKEIIKYVPEPRIEGFELYKKLAHKGFPQGGSGWIIEDPNGTETAYVPTYGEVIAFFMADPDKMEQMRDAVIRAYIELA